MAAKEIFGLQDTQKDLTVGEAITAQCSFPPSEPANKARSLEVNRER
jgi:hypothetical protein